MSMQTEHAQFQFIPAKALSLSPLNVRKTVSEEGIDQLAQLIRAEGVLQNLNVHPLNGKTEKLKHFGVVAGGRRLRALQQLIRDKQLKADHPVPCMVISQERALQISLSENSGREPMHPADEFEAFRQLIDSGSTVEDVAARFGVTPLVVQRRLKLANVAPTLIEAYRNEAMSLELLMAFTVSDNHERQAEVWKSLRSWERNNPDTVRDRLIENELTLKDPVAKYVGLKAYQKAGGVLRQDLFGEEGDSYVDATLIRQLAQVKLEKQAAKLRAEGLPWVETHLELDYGTRANYGRVNTIEREPTSEETSKIEALEKRIREFEAQDPDETDADQDDGWCATNDLLDDLKATLQVPDPEQRALAGALISIDHDGRIKIERDVLKSEDAARFKRTRKTASSATESHEPRIHSAALVGRLTAQRTIALQAELVEQPNVALVALAHWLLIGTFYERSSHDVSALRLRKESTRLAFHTHELEGVPAQVALDAARARIDESLPTNVGALLPWLAERSDEDLKNLLAFCVADLVDGVQSEEHPSAFDALAKLAQLNMTRWWRPTAENYFGSIPKGRVLQVITEAKSEAVAAPLAKLKKGPLALAAEKELSDTQWLPNVLRFG